eukprot:Clim_evm2s77 gene=Clim_evmTU2s77
MTDQVTVPKCSSLDDYIVLARFEAGCAVLLTPDLRSVDVPRMMVPMDLEPGSIVKTIVRPRQDLEEAEHKEFLLTQDEILRKAEKEFMDTRERKRPSVMTEVIPAVLYITNLKGSNRWGIEFPRYNIRQLISFGKKTPNIDVPECAETVFHHEAEDTSSCDIYHLLKPVADAIAAASEKNEATVLVCSELTSVPICFCMAYLMSYRNMRLPDAFKFMTKVNSSAEPNFGFMTQLTRYAKSEFKHEEREFLADYALDILKGWDVTKEDMLQALTDNRDDLQLAIHQLMTGEKPGLATADGGPEPEN